MSCKSNISYIKYLLCKKLLDCEKKTQQRFYLDIYLIHCVEKNSADNMTLHSNMNTNVSYRQKIWTCVKKAKHSEDCIKKKKKNMEEATKDITFLQSHKRRKAHCFHRKHLIYLSRRALHHTSDSLTLGKWRWEYRRHRRRLWDQGDAAGLTGSWLNRPASCRAETQQCSGGTDVTTCAAVASSQSLYSRCQWL